MKGRKVIRQFDVVIVELEPVIGSEQGGTRPCLVLQTNAFTVTSSTLVVAPFTSKKIDNVSPLQVLIEASKINGLDVMSKLKLDQIRTVDKRRVVKHLGFITVNQGDKVLEAIEILFDFRRDFNYPV